MTQIIVYVEINEFVRENFEFVHPFQSRNFSLPYITNPEVFFFSSAQDVMGSCSTKILKRTENGLCGFDGKEEIPVKSQETFQQVRLMSLSQFTPKSRRRHGVGVERLGNNSPPIILRRGVVKSWLGGGPATALLVNWKTWRLLPGQRRSSCYLGCGTSGTPTRPLAIS